MTTFTDNGSPDYREYMRFYALGYYDGCHNNGKKASMDWHPDNIEAYNKGWQWGDYDFWNEKAASEYEGV